MLRKYRENVLYVLIQIYTPNKQKKICNKNIYTK